MSKMILIDEGTVKQALEALEQLRTPLRVNTSLDAYDVGRAITALREALAEQPAQTATYTCGVCGVSMQMEQPAQPEPVAFSQFLSDVVTAAGLLSHGKTDKSLAARISEFAFRLRTSPPAQQQEPVAWVCFGWSSDEKHAIDYEQHEIDAIPVGTLLYTSPQPAQQEPYGWIGENSGQFIKNVGQRIVNGTPLYTSPPASKPLTDEQIDAIWDAVITPSNHIREFVRAIEAAHGIKGDA